MGKCKCGKSIGSTTVGDLCFSCYMNSSVHNDKRFEVKEVICKRG